jgi:hypothetical protein
MNFIGKLCFIGQPFFPLAHPLFPQNDLGHHMSSLSSDSILDPSFYVTSAYQSVHIHVQQNYLVAVSK